MTGLEFALPLIMGGLSGGVNAYMQQQRDKKERKWNQEDYAQQRADALADFERTNQYNSPQQQMVRLRQAGLNPNLVYGKGADNTSAMVRSSNMNKSTPSAYQIPEQPITQIAQGFMDMQMKQAQTDNLTIQADLMRKEALLKDVTATKVLQETANSEFQLKQANSLKDLVVEQAKANLQNTQATTAGTQATTSLTNEKTKEVTQNMSLAVREDERRQLSSLDNHNVVIQDIAERKLRIAKNPDEVALLKATVENAKNEGIVKQAQSILAKEGVFPNDPWYFKQMTIIMQKLRNEQKQANTTPSGIYLPPLPVREN